LFCLLACDDESTDNTCFSPTQNLETAYTTGAIGCGCKSGTDKGVCVPDKTDRLVALVCEQNRWIAVEDGPCGLGATP